MPVVKPTVIESVARGLPGATNLTDANINAAATTITGRLNKLETTVALSETTRWSADHDEGTLADWSYPGTSTADPEHLGGPFVNGGATASASTTFKRSGTHSAKLTVPAVMTGNAGARLFRWGEPRQYREAYYEAWYYFPAHGQLTANPATAFWNLFQFKSRNQAATANDPFWYLDVVNPTSTTMRARLVWWGGQSPVFTGPHAGESGFRPYTQATPITIPVGQWVKFRVYLKQNSAGTFDGAITVW